MWPLRIQPVGLYGEQGEEVEEGEREKKTKVVVGVRGWKRRGGRGENR